MLYNVSRNGQMYGPYTLEELRRYVLSGNVLSDDLAKNDAMPEWLPVQQILGSMGSAGAASLGAVPPQYPPAAYNAANIGSYPDPPNLPWGLVLLFNILTCGLFLMVWNVVMSAWMRRVQPTSQAMFYYLVGAVLTLSSSAPFFWMQHHHHTHHHPVTGFIAIIGWVIRLIARFSMKADLERHFNEVEPFGLRMSPVLTFFFGGLYIQSQLNRMNEIKRAVRFQAQRI
jgi:hypothetical protein